MTYDRTVGFIGPFEMLEYVCLGALYAALAARAPFRARAADRAPGGPQFASTSPDADAPAEPVGVGAGGRGGRQWT
jgi:hypothetical protein